MKKDLNKILLEAVHRGINLALDDFEDNELVGLQVSSIKDQNRTKDYIFLLDLYKLLDKMIMIYIDYSMASADVRKFIKNKLINFKFNNNDLDMLIQLSKKLNIKYKLKPELITASIDSDTKISYVLQYIIILIVSYLKNNNADLNWIDISNVKNMNGIFLNRCFNGDISEWDVSNVTNMSHMFQNSNFNGDISKWDVSNVTSMYNMFKNSDFNQPIGNWDVQNVDSFYDMFSHCPFNQDISNWKVLPLIGNTMYDIFGHNYIDNENRPIRLQHV